MSYQLTNSQGTIEAVIDDNCGMNKFHSIANALVKEFEVKFTDKQVEFDNIHWLFNYNGHPLKLHYNIYNGVSICTTSNQDNVAVSELAKHLERKFF
jgi:hypothetical protein